MSSNLSAQRVNQAKHQAIYKPPTDGAIRFSMRGVKVLFDTRRALLEGHPWIKEEDFQSDLFTFRYPYLGVYLVSVIAQRVLAQGFSNPVEEMGTMRIIETDLVKFRSRLKTKVIYAEKGELVPPPNDGTQITLRKSKASHDSGQDLDIISSTLGGSIALAQEVINRTCGILVNRNTGKLENNDLRFIKEELGPEVYSGFKGCYKDLRSKLQDTAVRDLERQRETRVPAAEYRSALTYHLTCLLRLERIILRQPGT